MTEPLPETASPEPASIRDVVTEELSELQTDVLWTEKAHFAAAQSYSRVHFVLGVIATVAAATAATNVVADGSPVASALASVVAAIGSALITFLKPQEASQQHLVAGRRLGALRVRVRQAARLDLHPARPEDEAGWRTLVIDLANEKAEIDGGAPAISNRSFEAARKKIAAGHFDHADSR